MQALRRGELNEASLHTSRPSFAVEQASESQPLQGACSTAQADAPGPQLGQMLTKRWMRRPCIAACQLRC